MANDTLTGFSVNYFIDWETYILKENHGYPDTS